MKLYRAMKAAADGLPEVGRTRRVLGIVTPLEAGNGKPDISPFGSEEIIEPETGGLSTAPDDPLKLPPFRRPAELGGTGKDPVWVIDTSELGSQLKERQDRADHVLVEPARPMTLAEYELALVATRSRWVRVDAGGEQEP